MVVFLFSFFNSVHFFNRKKVEMIIDDVVWNVIAHKHCSFRMKYLFFINNIYNIEHNLKISVETKTT